MATLLATAIFSTTQAQTAMSPTTKTMTKEEKHAAKAKKEADLIEAFTKAGLSNDEQLKVKAAFEASNEKTKSLKGDATITEDDKKMKVDVINKERNENLKTIMGEAKYKVFKETQKAQKEAASSNPS